MTLSLNNTLSKQICAEQLHHTLVTSMKLGDWASPLLHLSARVLPCSLVLYQLFSPVICSVLVPPGGRAPSAPAVSWSQ